MDLLKTKKISHLSTRFKENESPHIVLDDFLDDDFSIIIKNEIASLDSNVLRVYKHFNAKVRSSIGRSGLPTNILKLIDHLQAPPFMQELRKLTGEPELVPDKLLAQGGALSYVSGDFVNLHTDNFTHPLDLKLKTVLTLLIYFNPDWKEEYQGALEIRNKQNTKSVAKIIPTYNRLVILETQSGVIHGIPDIIDCPNSESRKAIVLWYYKPTEEKTFHPTTYFYKEDDKWSKKISINFGNFALKLYYTFKRYFGDWDPLITKIMDFFSKSG